MKAILPRSLILNLLLGADGGAISAREAVVACALFGIRDNSVRVTLARLAAEGMVEPVERGEYRIGPNAARLSEQVRGWRASESRLRKWSGAFVAVHCAGLGRTDRTAVRRRERALQLLGFRELDPDLHVRPDNLSGGVGSVRERLYKLGLDLDAPVFLAEGFDAGREARACALWDGKALDKSYVQSRAQLEKWLVRAAKLDPKVAARESFVMGNEAIRRVVFDPLLPEPLVNEAERQAFFKTVLRYDRAGHAIWRKLLAPLEAARNP